MQYYELCKRPLSTPRLSSDLIEDEVTGTWICSLLVASELAGSSAGTGLLKQLTRFEKPDRECSSTLWG